MEADLTHLVIDQNSNVPPGDPMFIALETSVKSSEEGLYCFNVYKKVSEFMYERYDIDGIIKVYTCKSFADMGKKLAKIYEQQGIEPLIKTGEV